jgi:hypothetical protein
VTCEAIGAALESTPQQTQVLLDLLAAVGDDPGAVQPPPADGAPLRADAHALVLFLFSHYYAREAARPETADAWPAELAAHQAEPSSPMRLTANACREQRERRGRAGVHSYFTVVLPLWRPRAGAASALRVSCSVCKCAMH